MKDTKRYDKYNQYENFNEEPKKSKAQIAILVLMFLIGIFMWGLTIVLTGSTNDSEYGGMFLGSFFFTAGAMVCMTKFNVSGIMITGYGLIAFIIAYINHDVKPAEILFGLGFIIVVVSQILDSLIEGKKEINKKNSKKNYYKKSDGGGMFIDGIQNKFDENTSYSFSEVRSQINDIKMQEQQEKEDNNGKMISDSCLSDEEVQKTISRIKAGMTFYSIAFMIAIPIGFIGQCAGILVGLLLISLSIKLFRNNAKQPEGGYNQNASRNLGIALGVPGALMVICNIIFRNDTVTLPLVFMLILAIIAMTLLQNHENTDYMIKNANELIQAECVDVEEKTVTEEGRRYVEYYPVFEIEYKGMHKRLRARFKYINPPSIGTKRIIHINPDNLDEWYDPQNMKQM